MKNLILTITLNEPLDSGMKRLAGTSIEIPSDKLLSPGIRNGVKASIESFLNSAANKSLLSPESGVEPRKLHAKELESIAKLVDDGSRIVDSIIFDEASTQVLHITLRRP